MGKPNIIYWRIFFVTFSFFLFSNLFSTVHSQQKESTNKVGDIVQGSIYGIKVLKAENMNEYEDFHGKVAPVETNHSLLVIVVKFFKNGKPLKEKEKAIDEIYRFFIIDSSGHKYPVALTESNKLEFRYVVIGTDPEEVIKKEGFSYKVFFSTPKNSSNFSLQYRDLPKIDIGI